jgi:hypothetical protein
MRKKSGKQTATGTLIRGADGALYFVPDGKKWAFLLPNEYTAEARALLDAKEFVAKKDELPALHGSGLIHRIGPHEVQIDLHRLGILVRRKPRPM